MQKKQRKVGRKLKLTAQCRNKIIKLVEDGNYAKTVCQAVGICEKTFYDYIKRGEAAEASGDTNDPFLKFLKSIRQARAKAELGHVKNIVTNSEHDPSLSKWWLERTASERWGKREFIKSDVTIKEVDLVKNWVNDLNEEKPQEAVADSERPVSTSKPDDV
ncbi:MAG: hypothetical protein KAS32_13825 [Candidatus Peribacteraceae bacterium]|nr:hypothetical protein [Candidatus Peribacteraceae bacterium]